MSNNVTFWYLKEDGTETLNENRVCFACVPRSPGSIKKIRYKALISAELTQEEVTFYYEFLEKILDKEKYPFEYKIEKDHVMVTCDYNDTWPRLLLHLTAFRCIDEFSVIVKELYKHKDNSLEEQFAEFSDLHYLLHTGKIKTPSGGGPGHSLIYEYSWQRYPRKDEVIEKPKLCTLQIFKQNFEKKNIQSVNGYFMENGVSKAY